MRHTLWVEAYSARLYVPQGSSIHAVGDPDKPKMLRIRMINTLLMPPEIPPKWRHALESVLDDESMKQLEDLYGGLREGDTVVLTYQPQQGVALRINDRTVVATQGHAAIDALLAAWAEDAPLARKLSGAASRHRCA